MPHSCIDVIGRESGTLRDGLWISIFNTSLLADKPNYLTNKHRRGGGAESSRLTELRTQDTEEDTQMRSCHPIFKVGGGENKDCGVVYCRYSTVVVPNKLITDLLS